MACSTVFSKVTRLQKLQGCAAGVYHPTPQSYKVTKVAKVNAGFPLKIHTDITKVTRLRRLQFFKIFTNKSKGYKVTEVTRLHRSMPNVFLLSFQVTMLSNYS